MRCACVIVFAACTLAAQVSVPSGKQLRVPALDATSVISLDLSIAQASLENGIVTITGVDPGDTLLVAVTSRGLQQIAVHVSAGPPQYPPGFVAPENPNNEASSYEFRLNSDRWQIENIFDLTTRDPGGTTQLHIASATFAGDEQPTTFLPSVYYRMTTPSSELTLLDQNVNESALTLQNVVVRGLHFRQGRWRLHGGYTTSATFANVVIPTEKEFVAGMSETLFSGDSLTITPAAYFFHSISLVDGLPRSAAIGSWLFNMQFSPSWTAAAEIGYGHSWAYAGELHHKSASTQLDARIMQRKLDFPALRTSNLPGLNGQGSWSQALRSRFSLVSGGILSHVDLATTRQDSDSAFSDLRYKLSKSWAVGTGVSYGSFIGAAIGAPVGATTGITGTTGVAAVPIKTLTLPQQIDFDRNHFGAGVQYSFTSQSNSFDNGAGIRQTLRLNFGRFQIGEYADWQKDAVSVSTLFSQVPSLQQELQRLGITATASSEIAALLQQATFLKTLGFANQPQVLTVPRRLQEGGNVIWNSGGLRPHRVSISLVADHDEFATSNIRSYNLTGAYLKDLGASNQMQLGWSLIRSESLNSPPLFSPLVSASFRHTFSGTHTTMWTQDDRIIGTVYIDSSRHGLYQTGMAAVANVAVILDGDRTVHTDALGHFRINNVSSGSHHLEIAYNSDREFCFTSPREVVVAAGDTVNFGIAFPKTDLWGYVEDDAGNGLGNIQLEISSAGRTFETSADASGKFVLPDVDPGHYQIQVIPESVPLGYAAEDLSPVEANVTATAVAHVVLKIPAVRILTGTVTVYDPVAKSYVPVPGAVISLPKLGRQAATNSAGRFTISGLRSGDLEIRVVSGQSSLSRTITVPAQPVTIQSNFKISSLTGEIAATIASAVQ